MQDEYPGTLTGITKRLLADALNDAPEPAHVEGPEDGHQFHFEVKVQGSYGITGDPKHYDADLFPGPGFQLTVRAWSLQEACAKAAQVPLPDWTMPDEEP